MILTNPVHRQPIPPGFPFAQNHVPRPCIRPTVHTSPTLPGFFLFIQPWSKVSGSRIQAPWTNVAVVHQSKFHQCSPPAFSMPPAIPWRPPDIRVSPPNWHQPAIEKVLDPALRDPVSYQATPPKQPVGFDDAPTTYQSGQAYPVSIARYDAPVQRTTGPPRRSTYVRRLQDVDGPAPPGPYRFRRSVVDAQTANCSWKWRTCREVTLPRKFVPGGAACSAN